jgi:molybdate transport system substrate-binding protein
MGKHHPSDNNIKLRNRGNQKQQTIAQGAKIAAVSQAMSRRTDSHCTLLVIVLSLASLSCSSKDAPTLPPDAQTTRTSVILSAAASTIDPMEALVTKFSAKTDIDVKLNTGPSNGLANQIIAGAPVDLFLSANQRWADEVQKSGEVHAMAPLLTNRLVIVVPANNPGAINEPRDLLSQHVKKIALAGENVPAGIYASQALTRLGLLTELEDARKIVRGQDVRFTISYVERGEVEAGIVYSTDAAVASGVRIVHQFDPNLHDEIAYVLVLLNHGRENPQVKALYEYLQSSDADSTYRDFGFSRIR